METENAQMRGYSDGSRVKQDGDGVEVREAAQPATLTTADGARYQATEEGRVVFLDSAENGSRRSVTQAPSSPSRTPGDRDSAFAGRPAPRKASAVETNASVEEPEILPPEVTGWGMQTIELLLKVFAIVLLLRLVFFWVDLSYSHASLIRFSLAFVVIGEIAVRFLSTALWAG